MPPKLAADDALVVPEGYLDDFVSERTRTDWPSAEVDEIGGRTETTIRSRVATSSQRVAIEHWQGTVETELYRVELDNRGGGIASWRL